MCPLKLRLRLRRVGYKILSHFFSPETTKQNKTTYLVKEEMMRWVSSKAGKFMGLVLGLTGKRRIGEERASRFSIVGFHSTVCVC